MTRGARALAILGLLAALLSLGAAGGVFFFLEAQCPLLVDIGGLDAPSTPSPEAWNTSRLGEVPKLRPSIISGYAAIRSRMQPHAANGVDANKRAEWVRKFWCEVNASDYFIVLFTLILAGSTLLLWFSTHKLWEASERALRKGQRPWVVAESANVTMLIFGQGDRYRLQVRIAYANTGNSLASRVFAHAMLVPNEVGFLTTNWNRPMIRLQEIKARVVSQASWPIGITIAPNQRVPLRYGWMGKLAGAPSSDDIRSGTFLLLGYLEYRDQFDDLHFSRFAFTPRLENNGTWAGHSLEISGGFQEAN